MRVQRQVVGTLCPHPTAISVKVVEEMTVEAEMQMDVVMVFAVMLGMAALNRVVVLEIALMADVVVARPRTAVLTRMNQDLLAHD